MGNAGIPGGVEEILTIQEKEQVTGGPASPEIAPEEQATTVDTGTSGWLPLGMFFEDPQSEVRVGVDVAHSPRASFPEERLPTFEC